MPGWLSPTNRRIQIALLPPDRSHPTSLRRGYISDAAFERISSVCAKNIVHRRGPSGTDAASSVLVALSTLETLTLFGLLDAITEYYKVHITDEHLLRYGNAWKRSSSRKRRRKWHFDLWNHLRDDPRFRFVSSNIPQEVRKKDANPKDYMAFLGNLRSGDRGASYG